MTKNQKTPWHVQILTLFPEMFPGPLAYSLAGKAHQRGIWSFETINIRSFAQDKRESVDDTPCGGGAGMVIRPDVLGRAIENSTAQNGKLLYMSPRGKLFTQKKAFELTKESNLTIVCGRYEGIDQRVIDEYNIEEISVGDYILSGGETAAITIMDSCIRLLPKVVGNNCTFDEESFGKNEDYTGLLEYPLYTRPAIWNGRSVPEVLLSGHHENISLWRLDQAKQITKERRSDMWQKYEEKHLKDE